MPGRGKKRVRESEGDTIKVAAKKHKSKFFLEILARNMQHLNILML